jgi:hypothetical protein
MSNTIEHGHFEPRVPQTPERKLWATCLLNGIHEALTLRVERLQGPSKRVIPVESLHWPERWLMDTTWCHVGSFVWICEMLGYDPDNLRSKAIMSVQEDAVTPLPGAQVAAASPFKKESLPMRLFRLMDEDADSTWTAERIMDTFDMPRSSVTTALRRLARKGLVEVVGKEVRRTRPRYLWRVKGEAK